MSAFAGARSTVDWFVFTTDSVNNCEALSVRMGLLHDLKGWRSKVWEAELIPVWCAVS